MIQSKPARMASAAARPERAWMVQALPSLCVTSAMARRSSSPMLPASSASPVSTSPSPATLTMSTPSLISRRASVTISSRVLQSTANDDLGCSIQEGQGEPIALKVVM